MPYAYDPELAPMAAMTTGFTIEDIPATRLLMEQLTTDLAGDLDTTGLEITDRHVPGLDDDPEVPIRVYAPTGGDGLRPAILDIHGGGFIIGSVASEHPVAVGLAQSVDAVVVAVEYRLAPEHPYPAGLRDCYAALRWLADHAVELGVDPSRIALYGQSAGGGLSAALALYARDHGGPALRFQFLGIPEVDDRLSTTSMETFTDTPMWNRPNAVISWTAYLGEGVPGSPDVPIYAAPARATDLHGLPSAYVSVMEFDPLRDEGIHYAVALLAAGVATELHAFPGTFHGSAMATEAQSSRRIQAEAIRVLREALHEAPTS